MITLSWEALVGGAAAIAFVAYWVGYLIGGKRGARVGVQHAMRRVNGILDDAVERRRAKKS